MRKALLVVLILCSAVAWAQGGCTGQKPLNGMTTGGFLKGVANASVRVCSDTLTPCTTIPLFSDAALTQSISNPVTTDATGNYQYCAATGSYNEQISGSAFSTVNNTPVTVSGSGDVTRAGNNAFTGSGNVFTILRGTADATQFAGVDMCAKVNAAWTYLAGLGWGYGEVDATGFHGRQDVAVSCWASYAATAASPKGFVGRIKFSGDLKMVTAVTQNPPTSVDVESVSPWVWPTVGSGGFTSLVGMEIIPSDTFNWATQKAVLTLGYSGGVTNPRGIFLKNIGVNCMSPNGTYTSGSIGIYNPYAQERTGGDGVYVANCTRGIDVENVGSFTGGQNSGPWNNLAVQAINVPSSETAWIGFALCVDTSGCKLNKGVHNSTFSGPTGGAANSTAISVNSNGFSASDVSIEEVQYGVEIGKYNQGGGTYSNVMAQGHSDFNVTAVIHASANFNTSFTAMNIGSNGDVHADYTIQDDGVGGKSLCGQNSTRTGSPCFGATKTSPNLAFYSCSLQAGYGIARNCMAVTPDFPAQISITGDCGACAGGEVAPANNTGYTALLADKGKRVLMSPTTGNVTYALPATPPSATWYQWVTSVSLVGFTTSVNSNGANVDGSPTSTTPITIGQGQTILITTQGTSYHTVRYVTPYSGVTTGIGGSALAAGACASTTLGINGLVAGEIAEARATDGTDQDNYVVKASVTAANTVTVKICAITAGTPTLKTYTVRILP